MSSRISFVCVSISTIAATFPSGSRRFAQSVSVSAVAVSVDMGQCPLMVVGDELQPLRLPVEQLLSRLASAAAALAAGALAGRIVFGHELAQVCEEREH